MLIFVSAVALVRPDRKLLLAERPSDKRMAGLWEFPGGKIAEGESPEAALIRELREELAIETAAEDFTPFGFASYAYSDFHLLMAVFSCRKWKGNPSPQEGQRIEWVNHDELARYPMLPADTPLVPKLQELLEEPFLSASESEAVALPGTNALG